MALRITLASASEARRRLLEAAGLGVTVQPARLDEETVRASLEAGGATPREVADALAEGKARKVAAGSAGLVLGADQVLEFDGRILSKAETREEAGEVLRTMAGRDHKLHSAAVVYEDGRPVWRHIGTARLHMRELSATYIADYLDRNWEEVRHAVGCYHVEAEGARFFTRIEGDLFTVQGLPLLELLSFLVLRGDLPA